MKNNPSGIDRERLTNDFEKVMAVLESAEPLNKQLMVTKDEFQSRSRGVYAALESAGVEVGLVFSDEHYCGDVPYLGGNTNITVEQVAGVIGADGFHIVAGLEGGYVAEQLSPRAGVKVETFNRLPINVQEFVSF